MVYCSCNEDFWGKTECAPKQVQEWLEKKRTEIVSRIFMVDRRGEGRVRVLSLWLWLVWFGIPTSTKGETSGFSSAHPDVELKEERVVGLEICQ